MRGIFAGADGEILTSSSTSREGVEWLSFTAAGPLTTKGDLLTMDGTPTAARLGIGADNTFLQALASEATGNRWFNLFGTANDWTARQDFVPTGIRLGTIYDDNDAAVLTVASSTTPTNNFYMQNADTTTRPILGVSANSANIGMRLVDSEGPALIDFSSVASAVNYVGITNAATGDGPILETLSDGTDADVDLNVNALGLGRINLDAGVDLRTTSWTISTANDEQIIMRWPDTSTATITTITANLGILSSEGTVEYNTGAGTATGPVLFAATQTVQPGKNSQFVDNLISFANQLTLDTNSFTGFRVRHGTSNTAAFLDNPTFSDSSASGYSATTNWCGFRSKMQLPDATSDIGERWGYSFDDTDGSGTATTQTAYHCEALSNSGVNRYLHFLAAHPPGVSDASTHEPNLWLFGDGSTIGFGGGDGVLALADAPTAVSSAILTGLGMWSEDSALHLRGEDNTHDGIVVETGTFNVGANTMTVFGHTQATSTINFNSASADYAMVRESGAFHFPVFVGNPKCPAMAVFEPTITMTIVGTMLGTAIFENSGEWQNIAGTTSAQILQGPGSFEDDPTFSEDAAGRNWSTTQYTAFRSAGTVTSNDAIDRATGFMVKQFATLAPATRRAFWVEDITASTNAEYLYFEGTSTAATDGSFHAPNLRVGSTNTGWGSGDGIIAVDHADGTEPGSGVANNVMFYAFDHSAGHTLPAFYCEGTAVQAAGSGAPENVNNHILVRINGTTYTLLAA